MKRTRLSRLPVVVALALLGLSLAPVAGVNAQRNLDPPAPPAPRQPPGAPPLFPPQPPDPPARGQPPAQARIAQLAVVNALDAAADGANDRKARTVDVHLLGQTNEPIVVAEDLGFGEAATAVVPAGRARLRVAVDFGGKELPLEVRRFLRPGSSTCVIVHQPPKRGDIQVRLRAMGRMSRIAALDPTNLDLRAARTCARLAERIARIVLP